MPKYVVSRAYFDNMVLKPKGSIINFEEGKAPAGSVLYGKKSADEDDEDFDAEAAIVAEEARKKAERSKPTALSELTEKAPKTV